MSRLTDVITIEDDDGFTTTWPFPSDSSILHQSDYVELCETMHDAMKKGDDGSPS